MEDDLIASLNRQIREEVLEHYLTERRIITFQLDDLEQQTTALREHALQTGRRLARLVHLAMHPALKAELFALLKVNPASFWGECCTQEFAGQVRFIRVRALTDKGKFRKLFFEAYSRLHRWMADYQQAYGALDSECRAVSRNIEHFQQNFDVLTILNFVKSLDGGAIEQKHFLGGNFTPKELAAVEKTLYIATVSFPDLQLPPPLTLARPEAMEPTLTPLAYRIFSDHQGQVRRYMM
jgi:hypothetical protein